MTVGGSERHLATAHLMMHTEVTSTTNRKAAIMYTTQYVPAKTSHILHLVLSFMTFGLWVPVWVLITLYNHNRSVAKQVPFAPQMNGGYAYPAGQAQVYGPPQGQYLGPVDQALQMALPPEPANYDGYGYYHRHNG